jgi:hypothetical protein
MFIVQLVGSDDETPFKYFAAMSDAQNFARAEAEAPKDLEFVVVYEWPGDFKAGLAAIEKGEIEPIMHFSHKVRTPIPPPEPPRRLTKKQAEWLKERIKKMPRIARKF